MMIDEDLFVYDKSFIKHAINDETFVTNNKLFVLFVFSITISLFLG